MGKRLIQNDGTKMVLLRNDEMKKLYPLLSILLLIGCNPSYTTTNTSNGFSQQEYNYNDLIQVDNGLWTEKFSDEPISGNVYGYFGEVKPLKKVYMGNLRNGKQEGKWVDYYLSTGKKKFDRNYKNGEWDGLCTDGYENGQKKNSRYL